MAMKFEEALKEYLDYKKASDFNRAGETYEHPIRLLFEDVRKDLKHFTFQDIIKFQLKLQNKYKDSTRALWMTAIRGFFKYCTKNKYCQIHWEDINIPRIVEQIPTYVVQSDVKTLCDIAQNDPRKLLCIRLLFFTGIRVSELCDIQISDLNMVECCGYIQRTRKAFKPKLIAWDSETNDLMIKVAGESSNQYLFNSCRGGQLTTRQIQRWVKELRQKANFDKKITPHTFRHGFTKDHLNIKTALPDLQKMLGHKNLYSVDKYTKRLDEDIKEVARETLRRRVAALNFNKVGELLKENS